MIPLSSALQDPSDGIAADAECNLVVLTDVLRYELVTNDGAAEKQLALLANNTQLTNAAVNLMVLLTRVVVVFLLIRTKISSLFYVAMIYDLAQIHTDKYRTHGVGLCASLVKSPYPEVTCRCRQN